MTKIKQILTTKGEISLLAVAITAFATISASALGAWATARSATNEEFSKLELKVESAQNSANLITEREANHYEELSKQLDRIEKKIDNIK